MSSIAQFQNKVNIVYYHSILGLSTPLKNFYFQVKVPSGHEKNPKTWT